MWFLLFFGLSFILFLPTHKPPDFNCLCPSLLKPSSTLHSTHSTVFKIHYLHYAFLTKSLKLVSLPSKIHKSFWIRHINAKIPHEAQPTTRKIHDFPTPTKTKLHMSITPCPLQVHSLHMPLLPSSPPPPPGISQPSPLQESRLSTDNLNSRALVKHSIWVAVISEVLERDKHNEVYFLKIWIWVK